MRLPASPFLLAGLALCALACDEDLPKATEIERMRLLGARVEVEGDPTRATPRPGETANVHFVAVHPMLAGANDGVQTMLASCTQPERYTGGVPICQEFLDAALEGAVDVEAVLDIAQKFRCIDIGAGVYEQGTVSLRCVDGEPDVSLHVAPGFEAEQLLYRGVVCEDGDAFVDPFDPVFFGCDRNDGEIFRVHGTITVQHEAADENHNPSTDDAHFLLGSPGQELGRVWLPVPIDELPPEDDCWEVADAADVLRADSFGNHQITVRWNPEARETFEDALEDVEFSLFATAGELEQRFVLFDDLDEPVSVEGPIRCETDADCSGHRDATCAAAGVCTSAGEVVLERGEWLEDTVSWTPPIAIESRSQIVRFFFTVLDRRGGFDWTTRAICLR